MVFEIVSVRFSSPPKASIIFNSLQGVLLAHYNLYVHKGGTKPHSFIHFQFSHIFLYPLIADSDLTPWCTTHGAQPIFWGQVVPSDRDTLGYVCKALSWDFLHLELTLISYKKGLMF